MTKKEFLAELDKELSGLAREDREKSFEYYSEIIDDRIDEGIPEEEAVDALGSVSDIAANIISEMPFSKLIKARVKLARSIKPWQTALTVIGALVVVPVTAGLVISLVSVYLSLWITVAALFVSSLGCVAGGVGATVAGFSLLFTGSFAEGFLLLASALVALGLVVPLFLMGKWGAKALIWTTKKTSFLVKRHLVKKEAEK